MDSVAPILSILEPKLSGGAAAANGRHHGITYKEADSREISKSCNT